MFLQYYGLDDGSFEVKSLQAVGDQYAVTRARVQQVLERTIWPTLRARGFNEEDEEWLVEAFDRIHALQELTGKKAKL